MQQLHAKKHFEVCSKNQAVIAFNLNKGYLVSCEVFYNHLHSTLPTSVTFLKSDIK